MMRFILPARSPFVAGVIAMLAALAVGFGWRQATGQPTPTELIGGQLVLLIPGDLFELAISALGPLAKRLLLVLLVVGQLAIGGAVASGLSRRAGGRPTARINPFPAIARSFAALLVVGASFTLVLAGVDALVQATGQLLIAALVYGLSLGLIVHSWLHAGSASPDAASSTTTLADAALTRRRLLTAGFGVVTAAIALAVTRARGQLLTTTGSSEDPATEIPAPEPDQPTTPVAPPRENPTAPIPNGVAAEITSNAEFYKVSRAILSDPVLDVQSWRLSVTGQVNRPTAFTLDDLRALPAVERQHTLNCISNQVGGPLISNAIWKGVRLADILTQVGVEAGARKVIFHGADFYDDSVTFARALDPDLLLAYEMNGVPLPVEHGFPLRALVPNIYGIKNVKWLTGIEVVDTAFTGYWEYGGWSDRAAIKTMSRVDVARTSAVGQPVTIGGIAFAGQRGISAVEVSVDGGKNWLSAQVRSANQANVWTQWVASWIPTTTGPVRVLVRAIDGRGELQTSTYAAPFPDGASGWHAADVQVG